MISILGIIWTGTVGLNCDFPGNDFKQVQTSNSIKCHSICKNTIGCTSYTWNSFSRTCFLKEKIVSISDAYFVGEWLHESYLGVVCGIISKSSLRYFISNNEKWSFKQTSTTSDWDETSDGKVIFTFKLLEENGGNVILLDASRGLYISLNSESAMWGMSKINISNVLFYGKWA